MVVTDFAAFAPRLRSVCRAGERTRTLESIRICSVALSSMRFSTAVRTLQRGWAGCAAGSGKCHRRVPLTASHRSGRLLSTQETLPVPPAVSQLAWSLRGARTCYERRPVPPRPCSLLSAPSADWKRGATFDSQPPAWKVFGARGSRRVAGRALHRFTSDFFR